MTERLGQDTGHYSYDYLDKSQLPYNEEVVAGLTYSELGHSALLEVELIQSPDTDEDMKEVLQAVSFIRGRLVA